MCLYRDRGLCYSSETASAGFCSEAQGQRSGVAARAGGSLRCRGLYRRSKRSTGSSDTDLMTHITQMKQMFGCEQGLKHSPQTTHLRRRQAVGRVSPPPAPPHTRPLARSPAAQTPHPDRPGTAAVRTQNLTPSHQREKRTLGYTESRRSILTIH